MPWEQPIRSHCYAWNCEETREAGVIGRGEDHKYIYIMQSAGLYKVGISNNVLQRRKSIDKKLPQGVGILYIGSVNFGRTIDKEQIIIKELEHFSVPVYYNDGTISREWFNCPIDTLVDKVSEYAELVKYN